MSLAALKRELIGLDVPNPHSAIRQDDGTLAIEPLSDPQVRIDGMDWPVEGLTMVGLKRLDNLQSCVETVVAENVPGDLIETGVWRGGASIFMRAVLKECGSERTVFVADSFQGFPEANGDLYPADRPRAKRGKEPAHDFIVVPLDTVRANFERYGFLDEQVRFVPGWFSDTLPTLTGPWSLLRLDGDLYESTVVALESLYPNLSPGGFVIIDDYRLRSCRLAVEDFRLKHAIQAPMQEIDQSAVYWRRP